METTTVEATEKQLAYAKRISEALNIKFEKTNKEDVAKFIEENASKIEYTLSDKQKYIIEKNANEDIKKLKDNTDFTSYNLCKKFLDDFFSKAKTDNV